MRNIYPLRRVRDPLKNPLKSPTWYSGGHFSAHSLFKCILKLPYSKIESFLDFIYLGSNFPNTNMCFAEIVAVKPTDICSKVVSHCKVSVMFVSDF